MSDNPAKDQEQSTDKENNTAQDKKFNAEEEIKKLQEELKDFKEFLTSDKFLNSLTSAEGQVSTEQKKQEKEPSLENMTLPEYTQYIVEQVVKNITPMIDEKSDLSSVKAQVSLMREKYTDYDDYIPTMVNLASIHPDWSPERVYHEAREFEEFKQNKKKENLDHRKRQQEKVEETPTTIIPQKGGKIPVLDIIKNQMKKLNIQQ